MPTAVRRPFTLGIALAGVVGILTILAQAQTSEPLAPEKYKNIQVLTDVPARQIGGTMDFFSAATSLGCVDCHVRGPAGQPPQYEIDTARKNRAREMVRMVKAMNAANYGVPVTCATCHAGHVRPPGIEMMTPERFAAITAAAAAAGSARGTGAAPGSASATPGSPAPAAAPDPPAPSVDAVLSKYFDAVGGRAVLDAMPPVIAKAALQNVGAPLKADITIDRQGDKFLVGFQVPPATQVSHFGFDGRDAWAANGPTVIDAGDRTLQRIQSYVVTLLSPHVVAAYRNLTAEPPRTLRLSPTAAPIAVNVLTGSLWTDAAEHLYFDATTGLLLRRAITTRVALGGVLEDWVDYAEYQPFEGARVPRLITQTTSSLITTLTITDIVRAAPGDDARFTRPKAGGY